MDAALGMQDPLDQQSESLSRRGGRSRPFEYERVRYKMRDIHFVVQYNPLLSKYEVRWSGVVWTVAVVEAQRVHLTGEKHTVDWFVPDNRRVQW
jgi:hypothetical protein